MIAVATGSINDKERLLKGADGILFSPVSGIVAVGIRVADCMPVFILSENKLIGAVHVGRRGLIAGIMEVFISDAVALGYRSENMEFFVGPHICGSCYEISLEAATEFPKEVLSGRYLNLYEALSVRLYHRGIKKKAVKLLKKRDYCTFENSKYCSYRSKDMRRSMAFAIQE